MKGKLNSSVHDMLAASGEGQLGQPNNAPQTPGTQKRTQIPTIPINPYFVVCT